jgi:hypothetical protein
MAHFGNKRFGNDVRGLVVYPIRKHWIESGKDKRVVVVCADNSNPSLLIAV